MFFILKLYLIVRNNPDPQKKRYLGFSFNGWKLKEFLNARCMLGRIESWALKLVTFVFSLLDSVFFIFINILVLFIPGVRALELSPAAFLQKMRTLVLHEIRVLIFTRPPHLGFEILSKSGGIHFRNPFEGRAFLALLLKKNHVSCGSLICHRIKLKLEQSFPFFF